MNRLLILSLFVAAAAHAAPPGVVLLLSGPDDFHSSLVELRGTTRTELATIAHVRGGIARAAPVGKGFAVIAQLTDARDASYSSSLLILDSKGKITSTIDRVAHASKPVVTAAGEVLVTRGVAGAEPEFVKGYGALLRLDQLSLQAVHPATGKTRALLERSGYLFFVAGVSANEAIVYAIGPGSTPLLGVDLQTGAVRTIAPHLSLARDFSVSADGRSIAFTEHAAAEDWRVVRVALNGGSREELARAEFLPFVPFHLPSGVAMNKPGVRGLIVGGAELSCAHGAGLDELKALSSDGRYAAGLHVNDGEMPRVVLFDLKTGKSSALPESPGLRPDVVGVRP